MKSILLRTLLLIVLFPSLAFAQDKIILTSGKKIKCKIISETEDSVKIVLHNDKGDRNTAIHRKYITSISYGDKERVNDQSSTNIEKRYVISANIGYNFPLGDFGSHDLETTSGYSKEAVSFNVDLAYKLSEFWGVGIKGFKTSNSVDSVGLLGLLGSSKYPWALASTNWTTSGAFGGLMFFAPADVSFHFRAMAGIMFTNSPELQFTALNFKILQKSVSSNAIGYDLGFGFELPIFKNANVLIDIDYLFSKFTLNNIELQTNDGNNYKYFIGEEGYQKFSMLNFSLGFGYKF